MTLRQRLLARAQRLLPYGIDAAGLVPAAVPGWGGSALAALPWPNPQGGHLLLCMQAQTQQALLEQGLAYLATARSARAPLPGCGARAHYRSWHRVGAGDLADPLAPPPAYRLLQRPGVAAAGGFFTCDQHGRHWLWLLPASAQIRLGWHQPQWLARWPRAARCG